MLDCLTKYCTTILQDVMSVLLCCRRSGNLLLCIQGHGGGAEWDRYISEPQNVKNYCVLSLIVMWICVRYGHPAKSHKIEIIRHSHTYVIECCATFRCLLVGKKPGNVACKQQSDVDA